MNSERTAQLQVALASYDLKELRVQKRYLQEQGTAIDCTCFCSGEKLLAQLRQGVRYDAVVLCSELTDLPAEQFVRQFYQLKERPMLLIQSHGRSSGTALQKLREGCYCVEGTELKRLLWQLYRMPGRQNRQLEQRCSQLYAAWGIPQGDVNAGYLSCAVGIACSTSQKLAIRKEILQAVSEQFDTSVAAVESGIRRMVDQLEEKPPLAWLAFKADTRLGSGKPTTGKLIYAVRDVVLRQKVPSTRLLGLHTALEHGGVPLEKWHRPGRQSNGAAKDRNAVYHRRAAQAGRGGLLPFAGADRTQL